MVLARTDQGLVPLVGPEVHGFFIGPEEPRAALQNDEHMVFVDVSVQTVLAAGSVDLETNRHVVRCGKNGIRAALIQHLRLEAEKRGGIISRSGDLIARDVRR